MAPAAATVPGLVELTALSNLAGGGGGGGGFAVSASLTALTTTIEK